MWSKLLQLRGSAFQTDEDGKGKSKFRELASWQVWNEAGVTRTSKGMSAWNDAGEDVYMFALDYVTSVCLKFCSILPNIYQWAEIIKDIQ